MQNGANMDYVATVIKRTIQLLEVLGEDAKKLFYAVYAIRLRNMFRRAGPEYRNAAQLLTDIQKLIIVKGFFLNMLSTLDGVFLNYQDVETAQQKTCPLDFKAVFNCSGSADLDSSSSRLLNNLVNKNICRMNLSRKGIEVNENSKPALNMYVFGPLLGGNMNKAYTFLAAGKRRKIKFILLLIWQRNWFPKLTLYLKTNFYHQQTIVPCF